VGVRAAQVVLKAGPCATRAREPRQIRKEAAVSEDTRAPQQAWLELATPIPPCAHCRRQVHDQFFKRGLAAGNGCRRPFPVPVA